MINIKKNVFSQLSIYSLCLYIISLFIFVYDTELIIISETIFIVFAGTTFLSILAKKYIKYDKFFLVISLLLVMAILSTYWSIDTDTAITKNQTLFQLALLMFLVFQSVDSIKAVKLCIRSICIGGIIMSIYSLYFYGVDNILSSIQYGVRLGGEVNQANAFGYYATITFIILLYYALFYNKWYLIIVSVLPLILTISSGSRRSLLILAIALILLLVIRNLIRGKKITLFVSIVPIIILLPLLINWLQIFDIFKRFDMFLNFFRDNGYVDDSILTRYQMIIFGWEVFKENPIIGYGIGQYAVLYNEYFGIYRASHNSYIQILVELGIFGFILYYGMYLSILKNLWSIINKDKVKLGAIIFIILISRLLSDFASYSIFDKFTFIYLGVSFAFIKLTKNKDNFNN